VALLVSAALWCPPVSLAQGNYLKVAPPQKLLVKRGAAAETRLAVYVQNGYHVNSNAPEEDYLIPLRLQWEPGALSAADVVYPKPEMERYSFSDKPLSVFTGDFLILVRFKAGANAPVGPGTIVGRLRYQACSDNTCYRPATVEIRLPYEVQ